MSNSNAQSLSKRQLNLLTALACGALLSACGSKDQSPTASAGAKPETAAVSDAAMEKEISRALAPAPAPAAFGGSSRAMAGDSLDEWVDDIRLAHPNKNAVELLNVPEVNAKLREALQDLTANGELRAQIDSTVDVAAAFIGLDGPPGAYKLNLDMTGYDNDRTDRMLKAVMSGKAKPIVDFVVGEIGEATSDLGYGGQTRAPNGVAIEPAPTPTPPPSDND